LIPKFFGVVLEYAEGETSKDFSFPDTVSLAEIEYRVSGALDGDKINLSVLGMPFVTNWNVFSDNKVNDPILFRLPPSIPAETVATVVLTRNGHVGAVKLYLNFQAYISAPSP
jgi:hypothetical protein